MNINVTVKRKIKKPLSIALSFTNFDRRSHLTSCSIGDSVLVISYYLFCFITKMNNDMNITLKTLSPQTRLYLISTNQYWGELHCK